MLTTMKILGLVNGRPTEFDGQYVTEYDPGRYTLSPSGLPMCCHLRATPVRADALKLPLRDAYRLWLRVDPNRPVRSDGEPNRPLTAYHVEIARWP